MLEWTAIAAAVAVGVTVAVRLVWHGIGVYRIRRAGPRGLRASRHRIWRDPGPIDRLDLVGGPGGREGAPVSPFRFVEEHASGSHPCVSVVDANGRRWRVKWGPEVRSEAFAVRFAWACGYFAEETYFVPSGTIDGCPELARARDCVAADGRFSDARFEIDDPKLRKLFDEHSWSWDDNPFVGTPQLNGLKIVNMLLSNWDTKDRRDVARGSNTAIFEYRISAWKREARYLITDWGGAMGKWGSNVVSRGRWDVAGFEGQTPAFVTGVVDGWVNFGYVGQRTSEIARGISVEDARWFCRYASRLTEPALRDALLACGATDDEAMRFARAIITRIAQLSDACGAALSLAG